MNKLLIIIVILATFFLTGCVGMNPNTGQRSVEHDLRVGQYDDALKTLRRKANDGMPWAQVRLGGLYEVGDVISQDYDLATLWYLRAAIQVESSRWAKGKGYFSFGRNGWYGQNLYAYTAQAYLGEMIYKGKGTSVDRIQAYLCLKNAFEGITRNSGASIPPENSVTMSSLFYSLTEDEWKQIREKETDWVLTDTDLYKAYELRL